MAEFKNNFFDDNKDAFNYYALIIIEELQRLLNENDITSASNLYNSLDSQFIDSLDGIQLDVISNDYLKFVDEGRSPGKFPPIDAIKDWVGTKGIDESAAWPIAHKIFKFGIEPKNILDDLIRRSQDNLLREFDTKLIDSVGDDIIDKIKLIQKTLDKR
jgi:hypothetical protein